MKGKRVSRGLCLVLVIISVLLSSLAGAVQTYSIQLQPDWFGKLNEHDVGESTCAPTAAINAFVFLQNAYPSIYGYSLVPDTNGNGVTDYAEMVAAAQALAGPDFMKTGTGGTSVANILPGIQRWIEGDPAQGISGKQPGVTFYQEQRMSPPDWAFLYDALEAGSAVILWLTYYDESGKAFRSHIVTLTGLQWTDQNEDGILNVEEGAKMTDMNPFNGNLVVSSLFQSDETSGVLSTDQAVGVNVDGTIVASTRILGAFVVRPMEQPVPITIDIKPGSDPNCFNQNEKGVIPVAILGDADLDVTQINIASLALQGLSVKKAGKSSKYLAHYEDINSDNYIDLIVQFQDSGGWIANENGYATLVGELKNGTPIKGKDTICIVP